MFFAFFMLVVSAAAFASWTPLRTGAGTWLGNRRVAGHADLIQSAALSAGIDPCLLAGIVLIESGGRIGVRSSKGALGLCQLMPATAAERALILGLSIPDEGRLLSDPELNATLGASYMAWLLKKMDGDTERALVAYNAGPGRLKGWETKAGGFAAWAAGPGAQSGPLGYARRVLSEAEKFRTQGLFP